MKLGFTTIFSAGKPPAMYISSREFRDSDVRGNALAPCAGQLVRSHHTGNDCAGSAAVAIAGMHHSVPRQKAPQAFLAEMLVAKEERVNAHQPVVVQGLHNGNAIARRRVID